MTNIKALDKLRAAGRNMAKGRNLENHEECNLLLVIADEIDREVSERYIELPCDAEGVPIHVGDSIELPNGIRDVVRFITINDNEPTFNESGWIPGKCRHVKPRTLEDVLEDFVRNGVEPISRENREVDLSDVAFCIDKGEMRKYAAEIRELMGVSE